MPRPRAAAWPSSARPSAPDCEDSASPPGATPTRPMRACRLTPGAVLTTPSALGPTSRSPWARTASSTASSRSRPSGSSVSEKPAETTSSARTPQRAASRTTPSTSAAGTATTASSGASAQVAQRARRADRRHHAAFGVHRHRDAGEAAGHDGAEDRAADAALAVRGAHDGDRGGGEQRAQRGHGGDVRAVGRALLVALGRAQVEREVDLAEFGLAAGVEACACEDAEHRAVAGHHLGVEARDRAGRRDLGELLEQPRGQAAAVHLVGHREGDLGGRRLAESLIARDGDDAPAEVRQQRHAGVAVAVGVVARHDVGGPGAVEAQVSALGRERVEERLDVGLVLRARRAQPQRGAIAQDDVADDGRPPVTPVASPRCRPARRPSA